MKHHLRLYRIALALLVGALVGAGSIYAVVPPDTITTVAGNGTGGYSGDGGPATSAQLNYPYSVALNAAGSLYITDNGNSRIRKVNSSGIIITVAGNGSYGYSGDGGPATSAELNNPYDVALDVAGNLYIADSNNNVIRKVDSAGTITTVAGNGTGGYSGDGSPAGTAQLNFPFGVALNTAGNLYIADLSNSRVRRVAFAYNPSFVNNFGAPIDSPSTLNLMKAGGSVPVKFNLGGNYGLNILAADSPSSQQVTCNSASVDLVEEVTISNSGLKYDAVTGQYIYTWKTEKAWANTCRQFTLHLNDGTKHIALFQFN